MVVFEFPEQTKKHFFKQFLREYHQIKANMYQVKSPAGDSIFFLDGFLGAFGKTFFLVLAVEIPICQQQKWLTLS